MFEKHIWRGTRLQQGLLTVALLSLLCIAGPIRLETVEGIPITLQSLVVILIPIFVGWRLGLVLILTYLLLGGMGLPVFAGGSSGWVKFQGTTAGFLLAFPIAAVVTGAVAGRIRQFHALQGGALMILGQGIILALGLTWQFQLDAIEADLVAILKWTVPGLLLKSGMGAILIALVARIVTSAHPKTSLKS